MNSNKEKPILNLPAKQLPIRPITLQEVEQEIHKRVSLIKKEFVMGFEFIKNRPKSVTFFGSARLPEDSEYYSLARRIGFRIAKLGYTVVTGGGPGIMEGVNRGCFEAGGRSLGLNIKLPNEQSRNPYLTDTADFYYFFIRKVMMSFSAEAYVFFPGGFGTFDELFEILTLVQTKKIEKVPVILVGSGYWRKLETFMIEEMLNKLNTIDKQDLDLYTIVDSENEIEEIVKNIPVRFGVRFTYKEGTEHATQLSTSTE